MTTTKADFSDLLGRTFVSVERLPSNAATFPRPEPWSVGAQTFDSTDTIVFTEADGSRFVMGYEADCCASCEIVDLNGNLADLVGVPIALADESSSEPDGWKPDEYDDSYTWTFYRLATCKGHVDIRWFGSSNGYYSESVSFYRVAA
jgi:hypothetical protein